MKSEKAKQNCFGSRPVGRLFDIFVDEFSLEHSMESMNVQVTVGRHRRNIIILK